MPSNQDVIDILANKPGWQKKWPLDPAENPNVKPEQRLFMNDIIGIMGESKNHTYTPGGPRGPRESTNVIDKRNEWGGDIETVLRKLGVKAGISGPLYHATDYTNQLTSEKLDPNNKYVLDALKAKTTPLSNPAAAMPPPSPIKPEGEIKSSPPTLRGDLGQLLKGAPLDKVMDLLSGAGISDIYDSAMGKDTSGFDKFLQAASVTPGSRLANKLRESITKHVEEKVGTMLSAKGKNIAEGGVSVMRKQKLHDYNIMDELKDQIEASIRKGHDKDLVRHKEKLKQLQSDFKDTWDHDAPHLDLTRD